MSLNFFIKIILGIFTISQCDGKKLSLKDVDDGPCIENISSFAAANLDLFWFGTSRYFYVPMASARCYLGYAEALLGRRVKSMKELQEMQLRIYTQIFLPPIVTNYGFGEKNYFRQYCIPNGLGLAESICLPLPYTGSEGSNTTGIARSEDTVVYTDNKTTVMFVRCINRSFRDFKVLTTGPQVDLETETVIRAKAKELGFNENLIRFMNYDDTDEDVVIHKQNVNYINLDSKKEVVGHQVNNNEL